MLSKSSDEEDSDEEDEMDEDALFPLGSVEYPGDVKEGGDGDKEGEESKDDETEGEGVEDESLPTAASIDDKEEEGGDCQYAPLVGVDHPLYTRAPHADSSDDSSEEEEEDDDDEWPLCTVEDAPGDEEKGEEERENEEEMDTQEEEETKEEEEDSVPITLPVHFHPYQVPAFDSLGQLKRYLHRNPSSISPSEQLIIRAIANEMVDEQRTTYERFVREREEKWREEKERMEATQSGGGVLSCLTCGK